MAGHTHHWVLVRREKKGKHEYLFFECINPGCPNPNRMEIH